MALKGFFTLAINSVLRNKTKSLIYIASISLCYIMLFVTCAIVNTVFFVIDKNINNEIQYRQFLVNIDFNKSQNIENDYLKYIKSIREIDGLILDESGSDQIKSITVTINDYRNFDQVLTKLKHLYDCDIVLNSDYVMNLSLIQSIKYGSAIMFAVIIICTVGMVYFAMSNSIKENSRDIAIYKAVGYNKKSLFIMILSENFIFSFISLLASIVIVNLLFKLIINPIIYSKKIGSLVGTGYEISLGIYFSVVFIAALVVMITSLAALGKTKRISAIELLKE